MSQFDLISVLKESCAEERQLDLTEISTLLERDDKPLDVWLKNELGETLQSCFKFQRTRRSLNELGINNMKCYLEVVVHFIKRTKKTAQLKKGKSKQTVLTKLDQLISMTIKLVGEYFLFCYRNRNVEVAEIVKPVFDEMFRLGSKNTLKRFVSKNFWAILRKNLETNCNMATRLLLVPAIFLIDKLPKQSEKHLLTPLNMSYLRKLVRSKPNCEYFPNNVKVELSSVFIKHDLETLSKQYIPKSDQLASACMGLSGKHSRQSLEMIANLIKQNQISLADILVNKLWKKLGEYLCTFTERKLILLTNKCFPSSKQVNDYIVKERIDEHVKNFVEVFIPRNSLDGIHFTYDSSIFEALTNLVIETLNYFKDKKFQPLLCNTCQDHPTCDHYVVMDEIIPSAEFLCNLYFINENWYQWYDETRHQRLINQKTFQIWHGFKIEKNVALDRAFWYRVLALACPSLFSFPTRATLGNISEQLIEMSENIYTVSRESVLSDTLKLLFKDPHLNMNSGLKFANEPAHDIGLVKEFYSSISREFQRHDLKLWMGEPTPGDSGKIYTYSSKGLFPNPTENCNEELFWVLGCVIKNASLGGHKFDFPFNMEIFKRMSFQQEFRKHYYYLHNILPINQNFLDQMIDVKRRKEGIEANLNLTKSKKIELIKNLKMDDGTSFDDLCINFTLPGSPDFELKQNGKNIFVSPRNVGEYLNELTKSLMQGRNTLKFKILKNGLGLGHVTGDQWLWRYENNLRMFYTEEICEQLCGEQNEEWTVDYLKSCCVIGNVYTSDDVVKYLYEVMTSFNSHEQKMFLKFVCDKLRLPCGGLKNLFPPLTIMGLLGDGDDITDHDTILPMAKTCFDTIYLPNYSSLEVTRERINKAMTECWNSYQLHLDE